MKLNARVILLNKLKFRKRRSRMAWITILLVALIFSIFSMSCSNKITVDTKALPADKMTTATSPVPITSAAAKATSSATTTPALTQTSFSLAIKQPDTYAENSMPIYLAASDTIHFVWTVSGIGEHIRMGINTPGGEYVGVKDDGGFEVLTTDQPCDQLNRSSSIVFKPVDQNWAGGYYIFHPYIINSDPAVDVKILYWIEH